MNYADTKKMVDSLESIAESLERIADSLSDVDVRNTVTNRMNDSLSNSFEESYIKEETDTDKVVFNTPGLKDYVKGTMNRIKEQK